MNRVRWDGGLDTNTSYSSSLYAGSSSLAIAQSFSVVHLFLYYFHVLQRACAPARRRPTLSFRT